MDYSWLDMHSNKYAQSLGGRISVGVSRNTESIVRTSGTEAGMVITLVVFTVFSVIAFKMELKWNHLAAFCCLILAVYFIFKK